MFDNLEEKNSELYKKSLLNKQAVKGAEDIFSVSDPIKSVDPRDAESRVDVLSGNESVSKEKIKKIAVFVGLLLVVGLIIYSTIVIVGKVFQKSAPSSIEKSGQEEAATKKEEIIPVEKESVKNEETPAEQNNVAPKNDIIKEDPIPTAPVVSILDSDKDGLTDEEENILGTDINNVDSDSDGLFDREEVKIYKTNPLNSDTDGDSYLDGAEVKKGYNPAGPGKLLDTNKSL